MASGVKIHDEVHQFYESFQIKKSGDDPDERIRLVLFKIGTEDGPDKGFIVIDKLRILKEKDVKDEPDIFKKVTGHFPREECRYGLYDCHFETKEGLAKQDIVFITWNPDNLKIKERMVYSSSKMPFKNSCKGVKGDWKIHSEEEFQRSNLVDILENDCGSKIKLAKLEGLPV